MRCVKHRWKKISNNVAAQNILVKFERLKNLAALKSVFAGPGWSIITYCRRESGR